MTQNQRLFIGRKHELQLMKDLLKERVASLVVLKGRRRIGKSRLSEEFGRSLKTYNFLGLAPESRVTAADQRKHFANQLEEQLGIKGLKADDWDDLIGHLAKETKSGRVLIILDEINWMGSKDASFLPKLKSAWDAKFSKNPNLILILSGSMSGWIEKNILSSTGFFGRISLTMTLDELPLHRCTEFWGPQAKHIAPYEFFKVLSVVGGVPRYLELIRPDLSAEHNIKRLCFSREGILFHEFDRIFTDLFSKRSAVYKQIVGQLTHGSADMGTITKKLNLPTSGVISGYLEDLVETGYLAKDYTWHLKDGKQSKLNHYRLRDNYLRFYLRYIEPKKEAIKRAGQVTIPQWNGIMGLQFENLVLNQRQACYPMLGIDPSDIVTDNPFFQRPTKAAKGCQIDLLIQTRFNTLYLCEIKFSKEPVGTSVISEVKEKMKRISLPRGFSIRPVIFHVNGVHDAVREAEFFSHIIDFSQLLVPREGR